MAEEKYNTSDVYHQNEPSPITVKANTREKRYSIRVDYLGGVVPYALSGPTCYRRETTDYTRYPSESIYAYKLPRIVLLMYILGESFCHP